MPAFMISAAHKSSGKTVVSTGLAAAFTARGLGVQSFKKGPDYIDPMWLKAASGQNCYNLDFNSMSPDELIDLFESKSVGADLSLLEANKGLFDGVDVAGSDSNAQLAKILKLPVILVIDTVGITRGIAPLLLGYQNFDADINIAGVILNKVGGHRHEGKLVAAVETYTDIDVLGVVHRTQGLDIGERHLGLTTPTETGDLQKTIARFSQIVGDSVDLDRLLEIARQRDFSNAGQPPVSLQSTKPMDLRIGIIRDEAFGFYYPDDLAAFAFAGAQLVEIDAINDKSLGQVDGLFIGGGFPEMRAQELSQNSQLRAEIKTAISQGLPVYAECGGLMYLCRSMRFNGATYPMVGAIEANAVMHPRPQGRGYVMFEEVGIHPWKMGDVCVAHEFHYASLQDIDPDTHYVRHMSKGHGIDGKQDGIAKHNLVAGFCHLRHSEQNPWVTRFVDFVRSKRSR